MIAQLRHIHACHAEVVALPLGPLPPVPHAFLEALPVLLAELPRQQEVVDVKEHNRLQDRLAVLELHQPPAARLRLALHESHLSQSSIDRLGPRLGCDHQAAAGLPEPSW